MKIKETLDFPGGTMSESVDIILLQKPSSKFNLRQVILLSNSKATKLWEPDRSSPKSPLGFILT